MIYCSKLPQNSELRETQCFRQQTCFYNSLCIYSYVVTLSTGCVQLTKVLLIKAVYKKFAWKKRDYIYRLMDGFFSFVNLFRYFGVLYFELIILAISITNLGEVSRFYHRVCKYRLCNVYITHMYCTLYKVYRFHGYTFRPKRALFIDNLSLL